MKCPICGTEAILQGEGYWCPNDRIFLGKELNVKPQDSTVEPGEVYQERAKKSLYLRILVIFISLSVLSVLIGLFTLHFTAYGFREKIFYRYNFNTDARNYLRSKTTIDIPLLWEDKPVGLTHSGYWSGDNVRLNSANDEVAIHEFAHAWWHKITVVDRKPELIKKLIEDTSRLSEMKDPKYEQAILKAREIVNRFCLCPGKNYQNTDHHHFYAYMAQFLMGRFKDGQHKLPEFMWPYFEGFFTNNPRVVPCYETNSCYFPNDNDLKGTL